MLIMIYMIYTSVYNIKLQNYGALANYSHKYPHIIVVNNTLCIVIHPM